MIRQKRPLAVSSLSERDRDDLEASIDSLADKGSLPDQVAGIREQAALVWECIHALPAKHQQVLYLRFYVGDSLEGIAAALGCSQGTVKSRLFHGLEKLRKMNILVAQFAELKTNVATP